VSKEDPASAGLSIWHRHRRARQRPCFPLDSKTGSKHRSGRGMLTLQVARRIDPRKVALALGGVWFWFAACGLAIGRGYGAYNLQTFSLHDSELAARVSNSSAVTAV